MLEELRQRLQALQRPPGIDDDPGMLPLGIAPVDAALGGGLACGALHEVAAAGEAHLAAATGFALGLASLRGRARALRPASQRPVGPFPAGQEDGKRIVFWIAEDMARAESGAPYGPGLDAFGLPPERLVTVTAARTRDLLWAMEEALRCRAVGAVIGELRPGAIDGVAVRRLSLAAAGSGALALLLRGAPPADASTAATRWVVGAAPSAIAEHGPGPHAPGNTRFAVHLLRNRRGPVGSWIIEWSNDDERFELATHAQPVAAPASDRPHRKIA